LQRTADRLAYPGRYPLNDFPNAFAAVAGDETRPRCHSRRLRQSRSRSLGRRPLSIKSNHPLAAGSLQASFFGVARYCGKLVWADRNWTR
jgi:hypothetical protein